VNAERLLYVGRFAPEKSVETLIDAVALLRSDGRDVSLDLVGAGPSLADLQSRTRELGVAGSVIFHGPISERALLYAMFDQAAVFVLPSLSEGLGCVLLEAMARGVPIVATAVGGIPELVKEAHSGLLVPPGQPRPLADAIARMLSDDDLRARCSAGGARIVQDATFEQQTGAWIGAAVEAYRARRNSRLLP
jgi:glycosyltransferase involved in cell wall biosynthesis